MESEMTAIVEARTKLRADLKAASKLMTKGEIRYLVGVYYRIQDFRKSAANEDRSLSKLGEPTFIVQWVFEVCEEIENEIRRALNEWTKDEPTGMGRWSKDILGIGPVISAGLLAHIDMDKTRTVGSVWRFAGLDPTSKWEKKSKRPWNAELKVLCWKIGESFVKVSGNPESLYGQLYIARKEQERANNEAGKYDGQAKQVLAEKSFRKDTTAKTAYESGKLPDGHIHARAKRWTVKVFLCHWWEEAYRRQYGKEPPIIYSIAMLGHTHKIEPED